MSFDYGKFLLHISRLEVEAKQKALKELTDDELMQLDIALCDANIAWFESRQGPQPDALLGAAVYREVDRRTFAASWFWRRLPKPAEYKKWLDHNKKTEEKARRIATEITRRVNPQA